MQRPRTPSARQLDDFDTPVVHFTITNEGPAPATSKGNESLPHSCVHQHTSTVKEGAWLSFSRAGFVRNIVLLPDLSGHVCFAQFSQAADAFERLQDAMFVVSGVHYKIDLRHPQNKPWEAATSVVELTFRREVVNRIGERDASSSQERSSPREGTPASTSSECRVVQNDTSKSPAASEATHDRPLVEEPVNKQTPQNNKHSSSSAPDALESSRAPPATSIKAPTATPDKASSSTSNETTSTTSNETTSTTSNKTPSTTSNKSPTATSDKSLSSKDTETDTARPTSNVETKSQARTSQPTPEPKSRSANDCGDGGALEPTPKNTTRPSPTESAPNRNKQRDRPSETPTSHQKPSLDNDAGWRYHNPSDSQDVSQPTHPSSERESSATTETGNHNAAAIFMVLRHVAQCGEIANVSFTTDTTGSAPCMCVQLTFDKLSSALRVHELWINGSRLSWISKCTLLDWPFNKLAESRNSHSQPPPRTPNLATKRNRPSSPNELGDFPSQRRDRDAVPVAQAQTTKRPKGLGKKAMDLPKRRKNNNVSGQTNEPPKRRHSSGVAEKDAVPNGEANGNNAHAPDAPYAPVVNVLHHPDVAKSSLIHMLKGIKGVVRVEPATNARGDTLVSTSVQFNDSQLATQGYQKLDGMKFHGSTLQASMTTRDDGNGLARKRRTDDSNQGVELESDRPSGRVRTNPPVKESESAEQAFENLQIKREEPHAPEGSKTTPQSSKKNRRQTKLELQRLAEDELQMELAKYHVTRAGQTESAEELANTFQHAVGFGAQNGGGLGPETEGGPPPHGPGYWMAYGHPPPGAPNWGPRPTDPHVPPQAQFQPPQFANMYHAHPGVPNMQAWQVQAAYSQIPGTIPAPPMVASGYPIPQPGMPHQAMMMPQQSPMVHHHGYHHGSPAPPPPLSSSPANGGQYYTGEVASPTPTRQRPSEGGQTSPGSPGERVVKGRTISSASPSGNIRNSRLYVSFSRPIEEADLRGVFEKTAPDLEYISKHEGKCFAFVKYGSEAAATLAMLRLNGSTFLGQTLKVTIADPPPAASRKRQRMAEHGGGGATPPLKGT